MKKKAFKKEEDSEEWCFVCKDGGDLIICDHKDCLKSYHTECVDSSAKPDSRFICELHKCDDCRRSSDILCYCCPRSVCGRCVNSADFVPVKGKKGFCGHCLKLTLLVEENKEIDSDGEKIDFHNRETYETLYKEYWEIINSDEKLTLEILKSAKEQLKSGKNYDSDKYDDSDEYQCSDAEENYEIESYNSGKRLKRSNPEPSKKKVKKKVREEVKTKSNKEEFTGWGSARLMQFLTNIGKDTTGALSQRDLERIIINYSKDKNLIQKKKTVECDEWLRSVFKRKTIKINRIFDSLETHLAENQVSSDEDEDEDEDELGYDLEENDHEKSVPKRKKKNNGDKMVEKKDSFIDVIQYHFASIVPDNIRLVYLRRSLVQKFAKDSETFESKVIGSFVRVKKDANCSFSRGSYQLMQITGVKKCLIGENDQNFELQALNTDIRINTLSDDDFSEEECQDLKTKVKSGILDKLELVALEEKARSLHKDIVSHWLPRELTLLKHRIDQANEKGRRKELFEYLERQKFLQNPENQSKLLEKIPTVVADVDEAGPVEDDKKDSPKSILAHASPGNFKEIGITSEQKHNIDFQLVCGEGNKQEVPASETFEMAMKLDKFFTSLEKKDNLRKLSVVKNPSPLFDSSDKKSTIGISKEELEDTECSQWFVTNLCGGDKVGPVSLSVLKNWSKNQTASKSKVYKTTQSEEHAIPLSAVLHLAFPRK